MWKDTMAIYGDLCITCGACYPSCPTQAIYYGNDGVFHVEPTWCTLCGYCKDVCPVMAFYQTRVYIG